MRALVNQTLTTAIETLFVEFQKTITEYDNEIVRLKEENDRKGKLLDTVLDPVGYLQKAGAYISKDMLFCQLFRLICVFGTVSVLYLCRKHTSLVISDAPKSSQQRRSLRLTAEPPGQVDH